MVVVGVIQLVREGKTHIVKHVLHPDNCTLHVQYDPAKATSFVDFFHPRNKSSGQVLVFIHGGLVLIDNAPQSIVLQ